MPHLWREAARFCGFWALAISMKKYRSVSVLLIAASIPFLLYSNESHADRALAFLESLTKEQRELAHMNFDAMSRLTWTYIPASMDPHAGISLRELDKDQRKLAHSMLKAYLSEKGYSKTVDIMSLETILFDLEGQDPMRDIEQYVIGIYGDPSDHGVWGWCFQGHHVSLNFTIVDEHISMAPRFLGTNPAEVKSGPNQGLRVLHAEEDLGIDLINLLDKGQLKKAVFSTKSFKDIVTKTSVEVMPLDQVGISYKELNEEQRQLLYSLIVEYLSTMPTEQAVTRMGLIEEDGLDDIFFGWAGSTKRSKPHYYRIQSKSFLVEFDNTQNNANHIHTVWRDFKGDFGRDLLHEHYQKGHH